MHTTCSLLDAFKAKFDIPSDYALAARLGVSRQRISHYRRGLHDLGDDRALMVARELGIDPGEVLISLQAERAKKAHNDVAYFALADTLRRLSGIAATILAVFLILPAQSADAAMRLAFDDNANYRNYTTGRAWRRLRFRLLIQVKRLPRFFGMVRGRTHFALTP